MKINIPDCFINDSEEYITIPAMRRFCDQQQIKAGYLRDEIINSIITFAEESEENLVKFSSWINKVLKEGIKHIYLKEYVIKNQVLLEGLKNPNMVDNILKQKFPNCPQVDIYMSNATKELLLQKYTYKLEDDEVKVIYFEFVIKLIQVNNKFIKQTISYPIYVDMDLENGVMQIRAKSKKGLFLYTPDLSTEDNLKQNVDVLCTKVSRIISQSFEIEYLNRNDSTNRFKNYIYNLFNDSTFTPQFIADLVSGYSANIDTFISHIQNEFKIDDTYYTHMKEDLNIFIEKYLSVTRLKKEDLQKDRVFYPIKTSSTDIEQTKHSTTSSNHEPLQCKEKFFDTKKSIQSSKSCDSVSFCHARQQNKYFGSEPFIISFEVSKGWCIIKLPRYVEEEDIQYVLSRFINT